MVENPYKTILHSKRANIYYLEHCRVLFNGGRVEYVTDKGKESQYWNIPIANTTCILLGTGTSITQAAMRALCSAGVMIGFCGGDGTPLFGATEIEWLSPQSEYRPTEYLQAWCQFWFREDLRFQAALKLQNKRLDYILKFWHKHDWRFENSDLQVLTEKTRKEFSAAQNITSLLTAEGRLTAKLYAMANRITEYSREFKRGERGNLKDPANRFLDHGNYLAYGLGATACWVLGLPHGLAVLHGKTRRGGLVFDAADIIKDAIILPQAFLSAAAGDKEQDFRRACTAHFAQFEVLDEMIETLKEIAQTVGAAA